MLTFKNIVMDLNKSTKKESKKRELINKAKREFKKEYSKLTGMALFPEDMGLNENQVLSWYKTELKLKAILKKHNL